MSDSNVHISGGIVGDNLVAWDGSVVAVTGGTVGDLFSALGVVHISGGSIGDRFRARERSVVNISGGTFGNRFSAFSDSFVHLSVTELFLDNSFIDLALGETLTITQRGGAILTGTLADGSFFDFTLNETFLSGQDYFDTNAILTVTLVPAPGVAVTIALGSLLMIRRSRRE